MIRSSLALFLAACYSLCQGQAPSFDLPTAPYNIGTAKYSGDENAFINNALSGELTMAFGDGGTKLYTTYFNSIVIHQFNLDEPYQVNSFSGSSPSDYYDSSFDGFELLSLFFTPSGDRLYVGAGGGRAATIELLGLTVGYYDLEEPFTLPESFNNPKVSFDFFDAAGRIFVDDIAFNQTFTKLFIAQDTPIPTSIHEVSISPDLRSTTIIDRYPIEDLFFLKSIVFSADGMSLIAGGGESIVQYSLTAPYTLEGMTLRDRWSMPQGLNLSIEDLAFNDDGKKLFVADRDGIYEFKIQPNIQVADTTDFVYDVRVRDGEDDVTFALRGSDASKFKINDSGVITFRSIPDFDNPSDEDENNRYDIRVTATRDNMTRTKRFAVYVIQAEEQQEMEEEEEEAVILASDRVAQGFIYPNPSSDFIMTDKIAAPENGQLTILNATGQVMKHLSQFRPAVDVSDLKSGVYFVRMTTPNATSIFRFVKN